MILAINGNTINLDSRIDNNIFTALHRDWLLKQKIRDENGQLHSKYSATEVEKYVNALPAYLADRCYDMQGPRGINTKKGGRGLRAPQCRQNEPIKPKRKYTRRGQTQLEIQQSQQQPPHQQQPNTQQSLVYQQLLLHQQPPQESPHQELSHQEPPCQEQPLQPSLQDQPFHFLNSILPSTSGAVAVTSKNLEYVLLLYLNMTLRNILSICLVFQHFSFVFRTAATYTTL